MLDRSLWGLIEPLKKIISPLKASLGITSFSYVRTYQDNSSLILTTEPDNWQVALDVSKYKQQEFTLGDNLATFIIWDYVVNCHKQPCGFHSMTMLTKEINYIEKFCFGTTEDNHIINYYYQHATELFCRFKFYFLGKADKLIAIAAKHKISSLHLDPICKISLVQLLEQKNQLLHAMPIRKVHTYNVRGEPIYITKQEMQCIHCMLQGKSSLEIATFLNLGLTTINSHIKNIKIKIGLYKASQLIKFFWQHKLTFFGGFLEH